ncbi:MAG: acyltransferase [Treponema sp.]|nr:acyltransferase [Treponema sp.]
MSIQVPIITVLVYGAWLALLLVGSRRSKLASFNQDSMSLDATKNLQGLAALGVICHHLSQPASNSAPMAALNQMQIFRDIGFLFVALFFFVSGYGLLKSLDSKPSYLNDFLRRRCLPIVVCFYVMNVFYIIWFLLLGTNMTAIEWVCKIIGVALLNDNAWFVPVILIQYIAFYFIFKNVKSRPRALALAFVVVAVQAGWFLFNKHFPWWWGAKDWWKKPGALWMAPWYKRPVALWFEGEWWVNSTIAFVIGLAFAQYEEKIKSFFQKLYWPKLLLAALLFASSFALRSWIHDKGIHYWLEFSGNNSTLPRLVAFAVDTFQVLSGLLFCVLLRMKIWSKNAVFGFFGSMSLEFYLMQALFLRQFAIMFGWMDKGFKSPENFRLEGWGDQLKALLYLLMVFAATIISSFALKFLTKKITGLLKPRAEKAK